MKATGIVRRIDDLGRVVIPKEIRRTMKIREGEPLEIYTEAGGSVIFKKYSPAGEQGSIATHLCDAVSKICGRPFILCDRDSVIAAGGSQRRDLDGKPITEALEQAMQTRQVRQSADGIPVSHAVAGAAASVVVPVIAGGDLCGCAAFLGDDRQPGDGELKVAQAAALFFAKQLED